MRPRPAASRVTRSHQSWSVRSIRVVLAAVVILLALDFATAQLRRTDLRRDTVAYHQAAQNIDAGRSMYDPLPPKGPHRWEGVYHYLYPPQFAATLSILPRTSAVGFARVWFLVLFAAYWIFAAALCRIATGQVTLYGVLGAGALTAFTPGALLSLNFGQADALVWAAVALAFAFPVAAGAAFGIAALLKLYAVWAVLAAAFRKDWRTVRQAAVLVVCATALAALVLGPERFVAESRIWLLNVLPTVGQGQFEGGTVSGQLIRWLDLPVLYPMNLSLPLIPVRLLGYGTDGAELPALARAYLVLAGVATPLTVAWLGRKWPVEFHYLAVLAAALSFSPLCRPSYLVALLPAAALIVKQYRARRVTTSSDHGLDSPQRSILKSRRPRPQPVS